MAALLAEKGDVGFEELIYVEGERVLNGSDTPGEPEMTCQKFAHILNARIINLDRELHAGTSSRNRGGTARSWSGRRRTPLPSYR